MTRALCPTCLPHYEALAVPSSLPHGNNDILVLRQILCEAFACEAPRDADRAPRCRICNEPMRGFARTAEQLALPRRPRRIARRAVHEVCGLLGVLAFALFMGCLGMAAVLEARRDAVVVVDASVLVFVWHVWAMIALTSGYAIGALCLWLATALCCRCGRARVG